MERQVRLRDRAVAQIKSILIFSRGIKDTTKLVALQPRLADLCDHYQTFNELEIELHSFNDYQSIQEKVDQYYYEAREFLEEAIDARSDKPPKVVTNGDINQTLSEFVEQQKTFYEGVKISNYVHVPKLNIEPFTGDYKQWPSFRDIFTSAVDSNEKLNGVHKLQLLKSVLRGEAAALLRHITTTEENYQEAWKKLETRYNKTKSIVAELIQTFLNIRLCTRGNCKELRKLCDQSDEIIRALRALGSEHEKRDPWLIHILLNKIDDDSRHLWAEATVNNPHPTFERFTEFLNNRCDALESCLQIEPKSSHRVTGSQSQRKSTNAFNIETQSLIKASCVNCNEEHWIHKCPKFRNLELKSRFELVRSKGLCQNCLRRGHFASNCQFKTSCLICRKKHHSLLHNSSGGFQKGGSHHAYMLSEPSTKQSSPVSNDINQSSATQSSLMKTNDNNITSTKSSGTSGALSPKSTIGCTSTNTMTAEVMITNAVRNPPSFIILPTAIINVQSRSGQFVPARVLLDSGSQSCFITESCSQRLGLTRSKSSIEIYGLASVPSGTTRGKTSLIIQSRVNKHYNLQLIAHIIKNITRNLPARDCDIQGTELEGIELADPYFNRSSNIDILIGIEFFFEILGPRQKRIPGFPLLQESNFGWLVAGELKQQNDNIIALTGCSSDNDINCDIIQALLKKFWEIEEIPNELNQFDKEDACELFYRSTTEKIDGRYQVRLPFKTPRMKLGESFNNAKRRLYTMEKRFATNREFYNQYKQFIDEYLQLGHMHEVKWTDLPKDDCKKYFLPHHAVFKASSTTQLRVVFDASCKSSNSISLNETLQVGPKIQLDLNTILLKFRTHQIAFVADIEKIFRQVRIHPDDKMYQLILWKEGDNLKVYMLDTVTYGLTSAPYLAVRTLKAIAEEYSDQYPEESKIITKDFYMDDLLSGANTIADALKFKANITQILESRGLKLRKWRSNCNEFLQSFTKSDIESIPKLIESEGSMKTLGIIWDSFADVFTFTVNLSSTQNWSKRSILSEISRIYDPLGWLSPIIVLFKLFLQKLWIQHIEWDALFPQQLKNEFEFIYNKLTYVNQIKIPRCYFRNRQPIRIELHAYSDASEKAYGCVVYTRSIYPDGTIDTSLVSAKSKVAPIKQVTIPRLELCAAFLLCKLVKYLKSEVFVGDEVQVFAWTDSMVVLHWLSDIPRKWKNFIANRTSKMLEIIPNTCWYYVPSKQNPADFISRGVQPDKLREMEMWWKGPPWLIKDSKHWPNGTRPIPQIDESSLEVRLNSLHTINNSEGNVIVQLVEKVSSWFKLKRIVVIIMRFTKRSNQQKLRVRGPILVDELRYAEVIIIRNIQEIAFKEEISAIQNNKQLHSKSKLLGLDPFIDDNGIVRVGGRLKHSNLKFSAKHPVILPHHQINDLVIREIHVTHLHAGLNLVLNTIRQRFWMMNARRSIKALIRKCIICIKYRANTSKQKMGDLPAQRVTEQRPFLNVGIDNAGPIYIKTSSTRNARMEKAYLTLFVCLSVKAIHIEVVSGMTSEAFLAAFKRFVARRGIPENVYCDNGSNFVAGNKELKKLRHELLQQFHSNYILNFSLKNNITFHFNPPTGAHFGGLWEAAVKSVKFHMKRVMDNVNLTFEEVATLTTQIEAILNSRPLCCIMDEVSELQILTPGHFLIGEALTAIPEPQLEDVKDSKLNRWQNIQKRMQGFWKDWRTDYLHTLQQRSKWKTTCDAFQINDVVLLKDNNLPPNQWPFAIVTHIHPGKDGIVRVVTIKCNNKEYVRPIVKLVKLPIKKE